MIAGIALREESEDRNGALVAGSKNHVIPTPPSPRIRCC
jgi:hypothetical protein